MGEITAHYGVRGWVRLRSYTRPPEEILEFPRWTLVHRDGTGGGRPGRVVDHRLQKRGLVVKLEGFESRDEAEPLIGLQVCVPTEDFPVLPQGEYYWSQLVGLRVVNLAGEFLGTVDHLLETGANDVLVVKSRDGDAATERLIPWIPRVVRDVDTEAGRLQVDWDPDF